ncbi:hypothetical protein BDR26DRAFT_855000 [Obelidium mucronatum]|nr:hypothetical protein BDR26DRAFT_855000 [Obelidium mucronatum]
MTLDSHAVPPQQPRTQFPPIIDATQISLQQSVSRSVPSIDPVGPVPPSPALPNIARNQPQPVQPAPNAANANVGIVGHVAAAFHHLFGDHDEDEFGDAAALLAVQQQQEALNAAAGGGGNAANGDAALQMAIRRRVEHPFYLAIKLSFLVYMITRGGVSSRSMIIMGAACVFFVIQFRAWYLQLRPQQPQQPRATPVATAADSPTQQLHGVIHETTVFQETYYFIHDFFASLFPESDDYLYNRERRGDVAQAAAADQQQQAQPAMAFI